MSHSYPTFAQPRLSQTLTVVNVNDSGAGSLRDAIATAQPGDTIRFAPYLAHQTITLTSGQLEIPLGKSLVIDGIDAPNLTISGNQAHRIFYLQVGVAVAMSLTIKNLRLANGYTPDRGAAIYTSYRGALQIENIKFANNVAKQGGGAVFSAMIKPPAPTKHGFWQQLRALQTSFKQRSLVSHH
ncbi:hypothetical protein ACN4EK_15490 [Pantanalinema rosaneae CENA516]|uniref:hypothetical protein n=1 Tax=Pantanalinema rosaneae TaxID=1620701 RepID=UPI003D6F4913